MRDLINISSAGFSILGALVGAGITTSAIVMAATGLNYGMQSAGAVTASVVYQSAISQINRVLGGKSCSAVLTDEAGENVVYDPDAPLVSGKALARIEKVIGGQSVLIAKEGMDLGSGYSIGSLYLRPQKDTSGVALKPFPTSNKKETAHHLELVVETKSSKKEFSPKFSNEVSPFKIVVITDESSTIICGNSNEDSSVPSISRPAFFGGMYGSGHTNPITGDESCPLSYMDFPMSVLWSKGLGWGDYQMHLCVFLPTPEKPLPKAFYDYGGYMGYYWFYGLTSNRYIHKNYATGTEACPGKTTFSHFEALFSIAQVGIGYCVDDSGTETLNEKSVPFGGFFTERTPNPVTEDFTCPDGFVKSEVWYGTRPLLRSVFGHIVTTVYECSYSGLHFQGI